MSAELFSYMIAARDIPSAGKRYRIEADAAARRRLAEALGIPEVASLRADLEVRPASGADFALRGVLAASVVQIDIVTLEPIAQEVQEEIDLTLTSAEDDGRRLRRPSTPDAAAGDERDIYRNGRIDLGEIIGEHLALGLDPYPKAPGADFSGYVEDDPQDDPSPFASLAKLKHRGGSPR